MCSIRDAIDIESPLWYTSREIRFFGHKLDRRWLEGMSLFAWCKSALTANHNQRELMIHKAINAVRRFFKGVREEVFNLRIEREIYARILPHLKREKLFAYPFSSNEEIFDCCVRDSLAAVQYLRTIEDQADAMGRAYGESFRHIMYRDLNSRLRKYAKLVQARVPAGARIAEFA